VRTVKFILFLVLALALGACATSGPKFSEYKSKIPQAARDTGRIYFYRPSAFGAAIRPNVVLNNETVGQATSYGFFYVDRAPGDYIVVTRTEVERKASFTLEKGQTCYIRFGVGLGFFVGHVYPELVDEATALPEISECKYTGTIKEGEQKQ
jgi:hypothetical protein